MAYFNPKYSGRNAHACMLKIENSTNANYPLKRCASNKTKKTLLRCQLKMCPEQNIIELAKVSKFNSDSPTCVKFNLTSSKLIKINMSVSLSLSCIQSTKQSEFEL